MAPEEAPAQTPTSNGDDIPLLAILAVVTNDGNLENLDWEKIAEDMSLERGFAVTAAECRIRVAQIIEHTIRLLEALAARRRNNLPANPLPAQIHPAPSINAPQHQNVPTGGPQPTSLSSGVAQPTQPGNSPSQDSTTSAASISNNGAEAGLHTEDEGKV